MAWGGAIEKGNWVWKKKTETNPWGWIGDLSELRKCSVKSILRFLAMGWYKLPILILFHLR